MTPEQIAFMCRHSSTSELSAKTEALAQTTLAGMKIRPNYLAVYLAPAGHLFITTRTDTDMAERKEVGYVLLSEFNYTKWTYKQGDYFEVQRNEQSVSLTDRSREVTEPEPPT